MSNILREIGTLICKPHKCIVSEYCRLYQTSYGETFKDTQIQGVCSLMYVDGKGFMIAIANESGNILYMQVIPTSGEFVTEQKQIGGYFGLQFDECTSSSILLFLSEASMISFQEKLPKIRYELDLGQIYHNAEISMQNKQFREIDEGIKLQTDQLYQNSGDQVEKVQLSNKMYDERQELFQKHFIQEEFQSFVSDSQSNAMYYLHLSTVQLLIYQGFSLDLFFQELISKLLQFVNSDIISVTICRSVKILQYFCEQNIDSSKIILQSEIIKIIGLLLKMCKKMFQSLDEPSTKLAQDVLASAINLLKSIFGNFKQQSSLKNFCPIKINQIHVVIKEMIDILSIRQFQSEKIVQKQFLNFSWNDVFETDLMNFKGKQLKINLTNVLNILENTVKRDDYQQIINVINLLLLVEHFLNRDQMSSVYQELFISEYLQAKNMVKVLCQQLLIEFITYLSGCAHNQQQAQNLFNSNIINIFSILNFSFMLFQITENRAMFMQCLNDDNALLIFVHIIFYISISPNFFGPNDIIEQFDLLVPYLSCLMQLINLINENQKNEKIMQEMYQMLVISNLNIQNKAFIQFDVGGQTLFVQLQALELMKQISFICSNNTVKFYNQSTRSKSLQETLMLTLHLQIRQINQPNSIAKIQLSDPERITVLDFCLNTFSSHIQFILKDLLEFGILKQHMNLGLFQFISDSLKFSRTDMCKQYYQQYQGMQQVNIFQQIEQVLDIIIETQLHNLKILVNSSNIDQIVSLIYVLSSTIALSVKDFTYVIKAIRWFEVLFDQLISPILIHQLQCADLLQFTQVEELLLSLFKFNNQLTLLENMNYYQGEQLYLITTYQVQFLYQLITNQPYIQFPVLINLNCGQIKSIQLLFIMNLLFEFLVTYNQDQNIQLVEQVNTLIQKHIVVLQVVFELKQDQTKLNKFIYCLQEDLKQFDGQLVQQSLYLFANKVLPFVINQEIKFFIDENNLIEITTILQIIIAVYDMDLFNKSNIDLLFSIGLKTKQEILSEKSLIKLFIDQDNGVYDIMSSSFSSKKLFLFQPKFLNIIDDQQVCRIGSIFLEIPKTVCQGVFVLLVSTQKLRNKYSISKDTYNKPLIIQNHLSLLFQKAIGNLNKYFSVFDQDKLSMCLLITKILVNLMELNMEHYLNEIIIFANKLLDMFVSERNVQLQPFHHYERVLITYLLKIIYVASNNVIYEQGHTFVQSFRTIVKLLNKFGTFVTKFNKDEYSEQNLDGFQTFYILSILKVVFSIGEQDLRLYELFENKNTINIICFHSLQTLHFKDNSYSNVCTLCVENALLFINNVFTANYNYMLSANYSHKLTQLIIQAMKDCPFIHIFLQTILFDAWFISIMPEDKIITMFQTSLEMQTLIMQIEQCPLSNQYVNMKYANRDISNVLIEFLLLCVSIVAKFEDKVSQIKDQLTSAEKFNLPISLQQFVIQLNHNSNVYYQNQIVCLQVFIHIWNFLYELFISKRFEQRLNIIVEQNLYIFGILIDSLNYCADIRVSKSISNQNMITSLINIQKQSSNLLVLLCRQAKLQQYFIDNFYNQICLKFSVIIQSLKSTNSQTQQKLNNINPLQQLLGYYCYIFSKVSVKMNNQLLIQHESIFKNFVYIYKNNIFAQFPNYYCYILSYLLAVLDELTAAILIIDYFEHTQNDSPITELLVAIFENNSKDLKNDRLVSLAIDVTLSLMQYNGQRIEVYRYYMKQYLLVCKTICINFNQYTEIGTQINNFIQQINKYLVV